MAFVAECMYCRLILRGVPDHHLGSSFECPRCHNCFTLVPTTNPLAETIPASELAPKPARVPPREKVAEAAAAPAAERPARRPHSPAFASYASFVLGSFAFFAAGVLHAGLLTLALGLAGIILGVLGLVRTRAKRDRPLLPALGSALSLAAVLVAVVLPDWLGLRPLWGEPTPVVRGGPASLPLSGKEVFRRPAEGGTLRVDASQDALHYDDVRLRVRWVVVGPASFEPVLGKSPPRERCLVIGLRITNAGITRNLHYSGWGSGSGVEEGPVLRDSQGKSYRVKTFPFGWVVKGRVLTASIPPGKSLDDVVVFEATPETVDSLSLELPGTPVGVEGKLKLEIPKQMIAFRR
jgi:hypothetical protein